MARNIASTKPGVAWDWTPSTWDNDKDDDPIVITLQQPSEGEKRQLAFGVPSGDATPKELFGIYEEAVRKFVKKVTNYSIGGVDINDGEKLVEYGEIELLIDVGNKISTTAEMAPEKKRATKSGDSDLQQGQEP